MVGNIRSCPKKSNFQCFTKDFLYLIRKTRSCTKRFEVFNASKRFPSFGLKNPKISQKTNVVWLWRDEVYNGFKKLLLVTINPKFSIFFIGFFGIQNPNFTLVKNEKCKPFSKWASLTRAHRVHCLRMAVMSLRTCFADLGLRRLSHLSVINCVVRIWMK